MICYHINQLNKNFNYYWNLIIKNKYTIVFKLHLYIRVVIIFNLKFL